MGTSIWPTYPEKRPERKDYATIVGARATVDFELFSDPEYINDNRQVRPGILRGPIWCEN